MYKIVTTRVGDNMVYQYYKYNITTGEFEICTDYNTSIIISGIEYFPVNGAVTIPIDIMEDVGGRLCEIHCELNNIRKDQRRIFMLLMEKMGWWG